MRFLSTIAMCSGLALAAGPLVAMDKTLSGVIVRAEMEAFEKENVLKFWPRLEADLSMAITSQLIIDDGASEPRITVTITKVAIDGDTVLPDTGEFNQLEGSVSTYSGLNNGGGEGAGDEHLSSYALNMTAVSGDTTVPEGWMAVPQSQDNFYQALIDAYADAVVERLN